MTQAPSIKEALEKMACALKELQAYVWGECPSLLDEDRGGNARLDIDIDDALEAAESALATLQPPGERRDVIALRRTVLDILNDVAPAAENLARNQGQADMDGVMVTVSRQALEEVLSAVNEVAIQAATASGLVQDEARVRDKARRDRHWSVNVAVDGENMLTIESNCLSGSPEVDDEIIRECAQHLLGFIGERA